MAKKIVKKRATKRPVGRPEFKPDRKARQTVERLVFTGMTQAHIARALGISLPTLRLHFVDELETGAARKKAEVINMLFASARGGNVSAQRKLIGMAPADLSKDEAKEEKRGKKEQQQLDAETVPDEYKSPAPPRLIVDNSR